MPGAKFAIIFQNYRGDVSNRGFEGNMEKHEKINYVEFPAKDIEAAKAFFTAAFGWSFVDYGLDYTCFTNGGIDGGFFKSDQSANTDSGSDAIKDRARRG